jgi:hypothetical protein
MLRQHAHTAKRYRQAIDIQDSFRLETKEILLPRHISFDMTIFCFLSGLCQRAKIFKFDISHHQLAHLQAAQSHAISLSLQKS